jgi:hypothetical protein
MDQDAKTFSNCPVLKLRVLKLPVLAGTIYQLATHWRLIGRRWQALAGVGRRWQALAGVGRRSQASYIDWRLIGAYWQALAGVGRYWQLPYINGSSLASVGMYWQALAK